MISRSGIEIPLEPDDRREHVGLADVEGYRSMARRRERDGAALERRLRYLRVLELAADIEVLGRVPHRARADLPRRPIGAPSAEAVGRADQRIPDRAVR